MKLTALMPARNESWAIGLSLRAAIRWCDEAVVLCHACTDDTMEVVHQIAEETGRVDVMKESHGVWEEMGHRQRLLDCARGRGATHLAIVDADEVLCGDMLSRIREQVACLPPGACLQTPMRNLHRSLDHYRNDSSVWGRGACTTLVFADHPGLCWKTTRGYDHHHREPHGSRPGVRMGGGGVMHLQFADWRRLTAKHALYKLTERIRWPEKSVAEIDRMYNMALNESVCGVSEVPPEWWAPWLDEKKHLRLGEVPWQEAECARLVRQYGDEMFRGLNLFGVVDQCQQVAAEVA